MKKLISVLMTLCLAMLLLTGCGTSPAKTDAAKDTVPPDIKAIKDRGVLKVGVKVDVPKFGFKDPASGKVDGFEIDLTRALAKKILGDETKIDVQGVTAKTRGPLLDNGEVDLVIATFTITEERKNSYNFSDPYFTDGVGLLVKKNAGISSLKDLDGKKIGVAQSATSKKALQEAADKLGIKLSFLEFGTYPEIKTALDAGRIDCFSVDAAILFGYLDDSTVILADRFSPQQYGVASKKSNTALAKQVNDTISEMKANGELDKLIQKWGLK
ncbi:transporter substrate-binding domain-containing protein [Sporomusa acidovorans]|uniref:Major cell-binding factor n=1 Tax=Sporomusa acidovorans (strain ATCC 49682 / DSM 3132 / Mol) TaxID=1123286 RepID=A0ABZ3IVP8_SPOA4|nr:transporter substrate-binding domain-containing protein [Sporomusa acidovorans]OZC15255.1 major cell-binding factor precursor [Sporomusa acidovorans DSM 3132]SDE91305.1 amino acid ABC transporter substrate-binding protein, PAAT family [Sporomusa acidovorans]